MAKIHLIANSHIDPIWLWRWKEGFAEITATFRSALDRLNEFPELKYTSACAMYYQWIEKLDPDMFEEIREKVKEGRWNIVGGWFLQPDCNMPCGESFARHGLVSQRYFKEKFGVTAHTGYNVDSFGHNASLPKILKNSGMDHYVFMRPMKQEKELPGNLFFWESDDGSRVCTFRIPDSYAIGAWDPVDILRQHKEKADQDDQDYMAFVGIGNHGGGPTIKLIHEIEQLQIPDMVYSTPDAYFKLIDKENLPVVHDELQHHARGCYSACSFVKESNRKCENNLLAAEAFCTMAKHLVGTKYPKAKLDKAWKNLMFNQFHDVLCGCSIQKAYDDAGYLYGEIMSITEQEINFAMQAIAHKIDTLGEETLPSYKKNGSESWRIWEHEVLGTPIVVFNPHTWPIRMPVELSTVASMMTDEEGREIPVQKVRGDQTNRDVDKYHSAFIAEVEPLGYRVYRLFAEKKSEVVFEKDTEAVEYTLENSRLKVEFSKVTGDICKLYDKVAKKYLIDGECRAILLDETAADTWAHDLKYLGEMTGMFDTPEFALIEDGYIRTTLRVTTHYHNSVLQRDYTITPDSDRLVVKTKVDFHEKHKTLKFTFPLNGEETIAQIPYGTIRRKKCEGEEVCGAWVAADQLCVANDCKYGYDTTENEMRLTILRGAIYADHFGERDEFCEYMEQGIHEFSYMLFPYRDNADAEKASKELNFGLQAMMDSFHKGPLSEKKSCFTSSAKGTIVTAIKQSEDGLEDVVRVCEMNGEQESITMNLFGKRIEAVVGHNEVKTFQTDGKEVNMIEW